MYPLLFAVCVNLAAAAAGVLAGRDLGFVICVVDITADWPAYLFATCMRHWNHSMHPCPLCDITLSDMTSLENVTADSGPWNIFTQEQYLKLIASSKKAIWICSNLCLFVFLGFRQTMHFVVSLALGSAQVINVNTLDERSEICRNLVYSTYHRGRALAVGMESWDLPLGARLEPSPLLMDVASLDEAKVPIQVIFWVGGTECKVQHESPLLTLVPGVTVQSWNIDLLHAWVLGCLARFIGMCIWFFLRSGIWSPKSAYLGTEQKRRLAIIHLKAELFDFYARQKKADPEWPKKHSEVKRI